LHRLKLNEIKTILKDMLNPTSEFILE